MNNADLAAIKTVWILDKNETTYIQVAEAVLKSVKNPEVNIVDFSTVDEFMKALLDPKARPELMKEVPDLVIFHLFSFFGDEGRLINLDYKDRDSWDFYISGFWAASRLYENYPKVPGIVFSMIEKYQIGNLIANMPINHRYTGIHPNDGGIANLEKQIKEFRI